MILPDWFPSPIKINLFLHVTEQRPDGYHLLQTLFQFLDTGDQIRFETSQSGAIQRIDHHHIDLPANDLCVEAANRLKQYCDQPNLGAKIHLRKQIPPGTGLGAGSSNAATVLLVLNQIWNLGLPPGELLNLGSELGADVPVFLHGEATWAEGTGDQFTPCSPPTGWVCVIVPETRVSTAEAFAHPDLCRSHKLVSFEDYMQGCTGNDLEPVVRPSNPEIGAALTHLGQYGNARMSGTGSAVYVSVESRELAMQIRDSLPSEMRGFIAQQVNQSPLHKIFG